MVRIAIGFLALAGCAASPTPASAPAGTHAAVTAADPRGGHWCIHKLTDQDGNLAFFTFNLDHKREPHRADFPYFVHINISTIEQNRNGHPTNAEGEILNRVEDEITSTIAEAVPIRFVGRATTRGFRELMYFASDAEKANAALTRMTSGNQQRHWEFRIDRDPEWKRVKPLLDDESGCL